jgi:O-antigen/teichoic acid export membrane protein
MKALTQRVYSNASFSKILTWTKLVSITGASQLLIQGLSFVSGILIIRLLPTSEYGLYTLANTMLGTMLILADGGITTGVMAQGGKVWQSKEDLGRVLATGLDLRRKFAIISLLVAMPALLYLLRHHGASWLMSVLIAASLIPAFFTALSGTLLEIVPRLVQHVVPLQKIQVWGNAGRLLLLTLSVFSLPLACIAILAAGLPQLWTNKQLKKLSAQYADNSQAPSTEIRKEIFSTVKRILPEAIYYCLSGQITIWLISIYGSTAAVAQVGALSRVAIVFTIASTLLSVLIIPRFARLPESAPLLFTRYLQTLGIMLVAAGLVVATTWLASAQILLVLGPKYAGLSDELVLVVIGAGLNFISGSCFFTCTSRGWVINPIISISLSLLVIVTGIFLLDISTLKGILIFNIFVSTPTVFMHIIYGFLRISQVKRFQEAQAL